MSFQKIAQLIADRVIRPNPIVAAVIATDGGLNNGTPVVTVTSGDATRRAIYLPPHAIQPGGQVFVCRTGPRLTDPFVVLASNYQVTGVGAGGVGSGSTLGVGATTATTGGGATSTDWATTMTSPTNADGALLPLLLGEVSQ